MHSVEHHDNVTIIHVDAELDVASAPALATIIKLAQSGQPQRIIVSLEHCRHCYSAGLAVLAHAGRSIGATLFVVVPAKASFRRAFEVTGLAQALQLAPTIQQALDAEYYLELKPGTSVAAARKRTRLKLALLPGSA